MDAAALTATWRKVIESPYLRDFPFKLELNEHGKVEFVMSPATNRHSLLQGKVQALLLRSLPNGVQMPECSILTTKGVKVADVVWASDLFFKQYRDLTPYPKAPELCVEVVSPSNTVEELSGKINLYLEAGALEVWLVREDGSVEMYGSEGQRTESIFGIVLTSLNF